LPKAGTAPTWLCQVRYGRGESGRVGH